MRHTNETIAAETLTGSLRGEEYADCTFTRCRWQDLRVENCSFANCTFAGCQWSGVVFSFTQMREGRFTGCAFRGIAWGGLQGKSALAGGRWRRPKTACSSTTTFPAWRWRGSTFPAASSGTAGLTAAG